MAGPQIYLTLPKLGFFPDARPLPPPPVGDATLRAPFSIPNNIYQAVLRPEVPVAVASIYIVSVLLLNAYNAQRKEKNNGQPKPWWIARQPWFDALVVAHNAGLIVYSALTFLAMLRAAIHTWPGYNSETGAAGVVDAYCKMHGPRGFGDAAAYNTTINIWEIKNSLLHLDYNGNPDPTDVGRLWNEGLAFWGWFFYVSKFYEVVDTLVIVAKGKRSPTLQTYHHSGAMLCMWAGIRYMSPPIWMFVFVNSFIHTLMYSYFTFSALNLRVPVALKRALTSMQIVQLIWGSLYAGAHLFLQYDMPLSTSYTITTFIKSAISSASSVVSVATSTVSEIIETPTPTGDMVALAKKLLLRAVGEEGIAERVTNKYGQALAPAIQAKIEEIQEHLVPHHETKWNTGLTKVDCLDTSGQAFAIWLNLLYLTPLTFLFLRFFIKAYTNRGKASKPSDVAKKVIDASKEAGRKTKDTVEDAGKHAEDEARTLADEKHRAQLRDDVKAFKDGTFEQSRKLGENVKETAKETSQQVSQASQKAAEEGKKLAKVAEQKITPAVEKATEQGKKLAKEAEQKVTPAVEKAADEGKKLAKEVQEKAAPALENAATKGKQLAGEAQEKAGQVAKDVQSKAKEAQDKAAPALDKAATQGKQLAGEAQKKAGQVAKDVESQAKDAQDKAATQGKQLAGEAQDKAGEVAKDVESKANEVSESVADDGKTYAEVATDGASQSEPVAKQESVLTATQPTRPGAVGEDGGAVPAGDDEDTDAMEKSGALVDLTASNVAESAEKAA